MELHQTHGVLLTGGMLADEDGLAKNALLTDLSPVRPSSTAVTWSIHFFLVILSSLMRELQITVLGSQSTNKNPTEQLFQKVLEVVVLWLS